MTKAYIAERQHGTQATLPRKLKRRNCRHMEDVWDEDAQEPGELRKIERDHGDAGFLEGITRSKEGAYQPGFDEGYTEGAELGIAVGQVIGAFQALDEKDLELEALKDLSPQNLFNSTYYSSDAKPLFTGTQHPLLIRWRKRLESIMSSDPR